MSETGRQLQPIRMNGQDAAKYLGVCMRKLQLLVSAGHIRYVVDPGGRRMYPTIELQRYVEKQMQEQWGQQVA